MTPSTEEIKPTPWQEVLMKQASLVTQSELPTRFTDLDKLLWKAFDLGKEYRDKGGNE